MSVHHIYSFPSDDTVLKEKLGHRKVDWSLQVEVITKDMKVYKNHKVWKQNLESKAYTDPYQLLLSYTMFK